MHSIDEARGMESRLLDSELITSIGSQASSAIEEQARINSFKNRGLALEYEQSLILTELNEDHRDRLKVIANSQSELIRQAELEAEASIRSKAVERECTKEKIEALRIALTEDLSTVNARFASIVRETEAFLDQSFVTMRDARLLSSQNTVGCERESQESHQRMLQATHFEALRQVTEFFSELRDRKNMSISALTENIRQEREQLEYMSKEIDRIRNENIILAQPLDELNSRKQLLSGECLKASAGAITLKNFRRYRESLIKQRKIILEDTSIIESDLRKASEKSTSFPRDPRLTNTK
jgi:hypothetical protein